MQRQNPPKQHSTGSSSNAKSSGLGSGTGPSGSINSSSLHGGSASSMNSSRRRRVEEDLKGDETVDADKQVEAVPLPTPYELLPSVWELNDPHAERAKVAELFGFPSDDERMSFATLELDDVFLMFKFAHEQKLTASQTRALHMLSRNIRGDIKMNPNIKMSDCFVPFKESLERLSCFAEPLNSGGPELDGSPTKQGSTKQIEAPQVLTNGKTLPDQNPTPECVENAVNCSTSSDAFAADTSIVDLSCEPFSAEQFASIMEYMSSTLFQHFFLYRTVFDPTFKPSTQTVNLELRMETAPPADGFSLDDAVMIEDNIEVSKLPQHELNRKTEKSNIAKGGKGQSDVQTSIIRQDEMDTQDENVPPQHISSEKLNPKSSASQIVASLSPQEIEALTNWVERANIVPQVQSHVEAAPTSLIAEPEVLIAQCVENILEDGLNVTRGQQVSPSSSGSQTFTNQHK